MKISTRSLMRVLWLACGCASLAIALLVLLRQQLPAGFLLAFAGLTAISLAETDIDYQKRFSAGSFARHLRTGRAPISTLDHVCGIGSYFCLAAALICWVAQR